MTYANSNSLYTQLGWIVAKNFGLAAHRGHTMVKELETEIAHLAQPWVNYDHGITYLWCHKGHLGGQDYWMICGTQGGEFAKAGKPFVCTYEWDDCLRIAQNHWCNKYHISGRYYGITCAHQLWRTLIRSVEREHQDGHYRHRQNLAEIRWWSDAAANAAAA